MSGQTKMEKLKGTLKRVRRAATSNRTEKTEEEMEREEGEYTYCDINININNIIDNNNSATTANEWSEGGDFHDGGQQEEDRELLRRLREQAALPITDDRPLEQQPWYHDDVERGDVGDLLLGEEAERMGVEEGNFLVRPSHSGNGHVLSVREEGEIRHLLLHRTPFGMYRWQPEQEFESLPALLSHYIVHPTPTMHLTTPYTKDMACAARAGRSDPWEIGVHTLDLQEHLGAGRFGAVRRAKWRQRTEVAVKIFHDDSVREEELWREVQNMRRLRHPNLVKLYGVVSRTRPFMIVMEYMQHGPLSTYLSRNKLKRMQSVGVLMGVCGGMVYLAEQRVVHGDLAARNVLLGKDLAVKIADFGLSRLLKDDICERTTPTLLPYRWLSVEVLERGMFSTKSDVWAFGVLAWEVFSGASNPYQELKTKQEVCEFVKGGGRLSHPSLCPLEAWQQLVVPCWYHQPHLRPDFPNLLDYLRHWQEAEEKPRSARTMGRISFFNRSFESTE